MSSKKRGKGKKSQKKDNKKKGKNDKRKGKKNKKKQVSESEESEEEGERVEQKEPEIFIPLVWRHAYSGDEYSILRLLKEAKARRESGEDKEKESGGENSEDDDDDAGEEGEGEKEEDSENSEGDDDNENSEEEEGEDGEKAPPPQKKEKVMTLKELLTTKHPILGCNLLLFSAVHGFIHVAKLLVSMGREAYGFSDGKVFDVLGKWKLELEKMEKLELKKMNKGKEESDSEDDNSEEDEDDEGNFFTKQSEEMEIEESVIRKYCKYGIYEGEMNEFNERNGMGKAVYPNGDLYLGMFKKNQKHGYGVYIKEGEEGFYIGEFVYDVKHSLHSLQKYENGDFYQGCFLDGKRNGFGRILYRNGDVYFGSWLNDKKFGEGTYLFSEDKSVYKGKFKNGIMVEGRWSLNNGAVYIGGFSNGNPDGKGIFFFPKDGIKQIGSFHENEWNIERNENMMLSDYELLGEKDEIRSRVVIITGGKYVGKQRLLNLLEEKMRKEEFGVPQVYILKRVIARPKEMSEEEYIDVSEKEFAEMKEKGEFEITWKDDNGFDIGIKKRVINEFLMIRTAKTAIVKMEKLDFEWIKKLEEKQVFVQVIKIEMNEDNLMKRLEESGFSKPFAEDIVKEMTEKEYDYEKIITIKNDSLEKNLEQLYNGISNFVIVGKKKKK